MVKRVPRPADKEPLAQGPAADGVLAAALSYAARGWSVIAVEARGKRPLLPWLEFQQRVAAPDEIAAWYRRWPNGNVAIVTGGISQLLVIDIDPQHGGIESLAELQRSYGALPRTVEVRTGGGGRHLYFAYPPFRLHNRVGIRPGIDLRCDGGYVVAPPSVHPSGRLYRWLAGQGPDELQLAHLPAWFVEATRIAGASGHSMKHWRRIAHEGVAQGERNTTLASFTGHLLWHGVDPEVALDLLLAWNQVRCRPPLPDEEVARVVQSIARLHANQSEENLNP